MPPPDPKAKTSLVAAREARDRAIAQLSDAFAHDLIPIDEFERRLTLAHRAESVSDIAQIVSDLEPPAPSPVERASSEAAVPTAAPAALQVELVAREAAAPAAPRGVSAILGGIERRGPWAPPRRFPVRALLGGIVLDFRDARLAPGATDVDVVAFMGGVQIVVPPSLSVEVSGTAIMGGFGHLDRISPQRDPEQPVLRIHGLALLGGVSVETRLPGESETDAHRRRSREGRALGGRADARQLPEKSGR